MTIVYFYHLKSEEIIFMKEYDFSHFITNHQSSYQTALAEIKSGRKRTHWIWFIFPQIKGLGQSAMSQQFAIENLEEARQFLAHPYLGANLIEISNALLELECNDPTEIMGSHIDCVKLLSSITLFSIADETQPVFKAVLDKFFGGKPDPLTISILRRL